MAAEPVPAESTEHELLRTRIHWGVLLIPLYVAVPVIIAGGLPVLAVRQVLLRAIGQPPPVLIWAPVVLALIPVLFLSVAALAALAGTEYVMTSRRLRFRTGWLMRASGELLLQDVEAILLVEPLPGQLLGYGTVVVIGRGGTRFPLRFIPSAGRFHAGLERAREATRVELATAKPPTRTALSSLPPAPSPQPHHATLGSAASASPLKSPAAEPGSFERAWQELNRPLPNDPPDDSRYMPKPRPTAPSPSSGSGAQRGQAGG